MTKLSLDEMTKIVYPDYDSVRKLVKKMFEVILLMPSLDIAEIHNDDFNVFYYSGNQEWRICEGNKTKCYYLSNQSDRYNLHSDLAVWYTNIIMDRYPEINE